MGTGPNQITTRDEGHLVALSAAIIRRFTRDLSLFFTHLKTLPPIARCQRGTRPRRSVAILYCTGSRMI